MPLWLVQELLDWKVRLVTPSALLNLDSVKSKDTEYWENGMPTCSKSMTAMIKECATTNAGCTVEQVMVS